MFVLAWRPRTRVLMVGLLVILLAAATVVVGGRPSAQAFECTSRTPKPNSCPFIRIDQQNTPYTAHAELFNLDVGSPPLGNVLYSWDEKEPVFTLWHWRWQGDKTFIRLAITPTSSDIPRQVFNFPASETHCYQVNGQGVKEVTTNCNDNEDPPD